MSEDPLADEAAYILSAKEVVRDYLVRILQLNPDEWVLEMGSEEPHPLFVQGLREDDGCIHVEVVHESIAGRPLLDGAELFMGEAGWQQPEQDLPHYWQLLEEGEWSPESTSRMLVDCLDRLYNAFGKDVTDGTVSIKPMEVALAVTGDEEEIVSVQLPGPDQEWQPIWTEEEIDSMPDSSNRVPSTSSLSELQCIQDSEAGALFVVQGDLALIHADAYLVPTDSFGSIRSPWKDIWHLDQAIELQTPSGRGRVLDSGDLGWLVLCDVGGDSTHNTVEGVITRFIESLDRYRHWIAEFSDQAFATETTPAGIERRTGRARPLLAMPLIGTRGGGLSGKRGAVIKALLAAIEGYFNSNAGQPGAFDLAIVCHSASDLAAVQHVRRERINKSELPSWLTLLADSAQQGQLAVMFGAGASAAAGLPMWSDLLRQLAERFGASEALRSGLGDLDPTDAATVLYDLAVNENVVTGREAFLHALKQLVSLERATLSHALLANLRPSIAITTNYDQGYELAAQGMGLDWPQILPWDRRLEVDRPLILKLHGDADRGLIVLSRDDFVAMHAYRRPLAGVLQDKLLTGHLLIMGSTMSDPTLVHAAEEVAGLIRQAGEAIFTRERSDQDELMQCNGTILMGRPHPARESILSRSLRVICAGWDGMGSAEAARRIDVVLDLISCLSCSDKSFVMDSRYGDLLTPEDATLAAQLAAFIQSWFAQENFRRRDSVIINEMAQLASRLGFAQPESGEHRT